MLKKQQRDPVYLNIFLFSNPHGHISGVYHIPKYIMAREAGFSDKALDRVLDTLSRDGSVLYDTNYEMVFVRSKLQRQGGGEKIWKACARHLLTLHGCPLIRNFLEEYPVVAEYCKPELLGLAQKMEKLEGRSEKLEGRSEKLEGRSEISSIDTPCDGVCDTPGENTEKQGKPPQQQIEWSLEHGFSGITTEREEKWSKAFPACDVKAQILRASEWLAANPKQTKSNYQRFLNNWLTRQQDRGGDKRNQSTTTRSAQRATASKGDLSKSIVRLEQRLAEAREVSPVDLVTVKILEQGLRDKQEELRVHESKAG